MIRTTIIEDVLKRDDLVLYNREVRKVVAVEKNSYTTDDLTHVTQFVWLDGIEKPVDASELERISPPEYIPY